MYNLTIFTEFHLMELSTSQELQILQGLLFLAIYLGALTGNLLTVTATVTGPHMHPPMFFFLGNLPLIDLCCISVTVPKIVVNSLSDYKLIYLPACAAQIFMLILLGDTEIFFLVLMSYDRYVDICHPLHYGLTITPHLCTQAGGGSWASGLVYSAIHTGVMFRLPFIELNVIHQYFCDEPQILRISSTEVQFSELIVIALSCILLVHSAFVLKSYYDIFSMVFRMCSLEAHNKALSTCTPQLAILIFIFISGLIALLSSVENKTSLSTLLMVIFYSMLPPFINPIIYSLWNREVKTAICRMFHRYFEHQSRIIWIKKF